MFNGNLTREQELELDGLRDQIHDIIGKSKVLDDMITKERDQRFPNGFDNRDAQDEATCLVWLRVMGRFLDTIA